MHFLPNYLEVSIIILNFALNKSHHRFSSARNAAYQGGPFFILNDYGIYKATSHTQAAD